MSERRLGMSGPVRLGLGTVVMLTMASANLSCGGGRPAPTDQATSESAPPEPAGDSMNVGPNVATEAESKARMSTKSGEASAKASPAARPGEGPQAGMPPTRVKTVDRATLIELVNGAKGRPTAVVFWASWVAHREILPKIMADVRKKHPRFRVFLVSLASDESRTQVETESGSLDADEICVHYSRDVDEALAAFELDADGLPGVRLYDPQGRLVVSFGLEADTPDDLLRIMEQRLAEASEQIPDRD